MITFQHALHRLTLTLIDHVSANNVTGPFALKNDHTKQGKRNAIAINHRPNRPIIDCRVCCDEGDETDRSIVGEAKNRMRHKSCVLASVHVACLPFFSAILVRFRWEPYFYPKILSRLLDLRRKNNREDRKREKERKRIW